MKLHPIILCGGTGSRLWPLLGYEHPKQLLQLFCGRMRFRRSEIGLGYFERFPGVSGCA